MDSDSNPDIHDSVYRVEEWSRQIKQWTEADKANIGLVNQFMGGLAIVTVIQGLFLIPATRNLLPSDMRLATNLAALALVIGIGGVLIGIASSRSFYARTETNTILLNDLLQFRSDLLLILEWNKGDLAGGPYSGVSSMKIGGSGDTAVNFLSEPAFRVGGSHTMNVIIGGRGRTSVNFDGVAIDQVNTPVPDRRERLQRAKFFLQDVQHRCCFRSERRLIGNLLVVVRRLSRPSQTPPDQPRNPPSPSPEGDSEYNNSTARLAITPFLFQALWFCLCLSSACFGTSTALFLGVMASGEIFGPIFQISCLLIFPGVLILISFTPGDQTRMNATSHYTQEAFAGPNAEPARHPKL